MSYTSRYYAYRCAECQGQQNNDSGCYEHRIECRYFGTNSSKRIPTVYGIDPTLAAWLRSPAP